MTVLALFNRKNFPDIFSFSNHSLKAHKSLETESPLKAMKNAFYFTLKTLLVHKIYRILSRLFGHVEKRIV